MEILIVIWIWLFTMLIAYAFGFVRGEKEGKANSIHWDDILAAFRGVNLRHEIMNFNNVRIETQDGCFEWVRGQEVDKVIDNLNALRERSVQ